MSDDTTTPAKTRSKTAGMELGAVLLAQDKGRVHDDGTDRFREVVAAVASTGGKGKVVVTFEVEPLDPDTFADTGAVSVSAKVESTIPRPKRAASFYFANRAGHLTREDPQSADPRD